MSIIKVHSGKPYSGFLVAYREFEFFEGDIIPNPRWVSSDFITMTTNDSFFPIRIIKKSEITKIDDQIYANESIDMDPKKFLIAGSKNKTYQVSMINNFWSCECVGFQYRGNCKHVNSAKTQL